MENTTTAVLIVSGAVAAIAGYVIFETNRKKNSANGNGNGNGVTPTTQLPEGWHPPMALPPDYVQPSWNPNTLLPAFMQNWFNEFDEQPQIPDNVWEWSIIKN